MSCHHHPERRKSKCFPFEFNLRASSLLQSVTGVLNLRNKKREKKLSAWELSTTGSCLSELSQNSPWSGHHFSVVDLAEMLPVTFVLARQVQVQPCGSFYQTFLCVSPRAPSFFLPSFDVPVHMHGDDFRISETNPPVGRGVAHDQKHNFCLLSIDHILYLYLSGA